MQDDVVIKVENISKRYEIGETSSFVTLRDKLIELPSRIFKGPKRTKTFWALKDVSFEVRRGEVVGIIGKNGAGKSTLLKILARITEPTSGRITMHGRVASMLEVGTGFNPELTGRENIYLNGAIIGMARKEIDAKFADIVEFSGIEKFLDTPVKHYSSGMYVRLAFAVAAHLDADILLVDEVLAVGDAEFQKKCLGKMSDLAHSGRTVIFVSHNSAAVRKLCTSCIWIKDGKTMSVGSAQETLDSYLSISLNTIMSKTEHTEQNAIDNLFKVKAVRWIDKKGNSVDYYHYGEENILRFTVYFPKPIKNIGFGFALLNNQLERILTSHHVDDISNDMPKTFKGTITFDLQLGLRTIAPGTYNIIVGARDQTTKKTIFYSERYHPLKIYESDILIDGASGYLWHPGKWRLNKGGE